MDYNGLIEQLRNAFPVDGYELERSVCESAADAIETLLAERDAAVETLRYMGCDVCKYKKVDWSEEPCCSCHRVGGWKDGWHWRGPQEEAKSHGY